MFPLPHFLSSHCFISKIEAFESIIDVGLTVLSHVDHIIEKCENSILILLKNISHFDHVVVLIKERVVEDELKSRFEFLGTFAVFYFLRIKWHSKSLTYRFASTSFSFEIFCIFINTVLELL